MSHEFRTPVNSIIALSRLLADHSDGPLNAEQSKQVAFIRKAADSLLELVNDLLDLAKVEAGKVVVRPAEFQVANLFGALRGMLRPLLLNESLNLVFEDASDLPSMCTDEGKVSQILRNFISNALKFTERGEVRVSAKLSEDGSAILFSVADTGIGIAPEDQERIFHEFSQLENPMQKKVKGTGLGLPLSRKLAELLGGSLSVESTPGVGSTFRAIIPVEYRSAGRETTVIEETPAIGPGLTPILVVEDDPETVLVYEKYLRGTSYQMFAARTLRQARETLHRVHPRAVVLDLLLSGEETWHFLTELKNDEHRPSVPVIVATTVEDHQKAYALGADDYCLKPVSRETLLAKLSAAVRRSGPPKVLMIDDDEVSRYLVRQSLRGRAFDFIEAGDALTGLELAARAQPAVIVLDLVMPDHSGFYVLDHLRQNPATRDIPVVVLSSKSVSEHERQHLESGVSAVLNKALLSDDLMKKALDEALLGSLEGRRFAGSAS
jgi:CheY-like chemotaxis protein